MSERRSGADRRQHPPGRPVMSRGPIIRGLEALSALSGLASVLALVLVLTAGSQRLDSIQRSRELSARDTCYLIRGQLLALTPPRRRPFVVTYLDRPANPLHDCVAYGRRVRHLGISP